MRFPKFGDNNNNNVFKYSLTMLFPVEEEFSIYCNTTHIFPHLKLLFSYSRFPFLAMQSLLLK